MAKTWKKSTDIDVTPEKLFEVLIGEEFQLASAKLDPAVLETEYREISRTDEKLRFEIRNTEYSRSLTGIDKSKRDHSTTQYDFDLKRKRGTWFYKSDNSFMDRIKISGTEAVDGSGGRARLTSETTLEVRIPLIGGKVESFILKEIESQRPGFEAALREHCAKVG